MTSSPLPALSSETDSPTPSPSNVALSKDFQDHMMDVGSTSGDSGVDANSDIGSELVSDASVDLVTKDTTDAKTPSMMDVLEPESSSAFIPLTAHKLS